MFKSRLKKVIFASFGVALSIFMLSTVLCLWLLNGTVVVQFVNDYMLQVLAVLTLVSIPIVNKYLE
jgi:hypothetical protein